MRFEKIKTRISENTKINGFIETTGLLRIDGTLKGGIREASGVVIGNTGLVEGDIHSKSVQVGGRVEGNIFSEFMLELLQNSSLRGDIETDKLSIAEGAHFHGMCTMIEKEAGEEDIEEKGAL